MQALLADAGFSVEEVEDRTEFGIAFFRERLSCRRSAFAAWSPPADGRDRAPEVPEYAPEPRARVHRARDDDRPPRRLSAGPQRWRLPCDFCSRPTRDPQVKQGAGSCIRATRETWNAPRREDPHQPARSPGRHGGVHGAGRKLPCRPRRPARLQSHQDRHLPPGGRRRDDGGGVGQDHGRAGRLLRHARARRGQRHERAARGAAGFHADGAVRRHAGARARGSRGVPGDRGEAAVLLVREMGRGDPADGTHPRVREPRLPRGALRASGPRGARPARGHAVRHREAIDAKPARVAAPAPSCRRRRAAAGPARQGARGP